MPRGDGRYSARVAGHEFVAKTQDAALQGAARGAWRAQADGVPRGRPLLEALERLREGVRSAALAESANRLRYARVDGLALGCTLPAKAADVRRDPAGMAARWLEEIERRIEVVRERVERTEACGPVVVGDQTIGVVYADPPWDYRDGGTRAHPEYAGVQRENARYATLPDADIAALGEELLPSLERDALLFLWVTNSVLVEGRHLAICRAWGFEPRVLIPWIKWAPEATAPALGMGHYTRGVSEELCVAARGRVDLSFEGDRIILAARGRAASTVVQSKSERGLILSARRAHSEKPEEAYELIERLVTPRAVSGFADDEPAWLCSRCGEVVSTDQTWEPGEGAPHIEACRPAMLELFARRARPGWLAWGAEAPR